MLQKKATTIVQWLFALSIILCSGSMLGVLYGEGSLGLSDFKLRIISILITGVYVLLHIKKIKTVGKVQFKLFFFLMFYILVYIIATHYSVRSSLEAFIVPFFLFFILSVLEKKRFLFDFFNRYSKITVILSAVSLFFYIFGYVLKWIPGMALTYSNNGEIYPCIGYCYLSFINYAQYQEIAGLHLMRNVGIFMEGPGYATPLIISLYWCLFSKKDSKGIKNEVSVLLLVTTLVTTFSAKAYTFTVAIILASIIKTLRKNQARWKKPRPYVLPTIIIGGIVLIVLFVGVRVVTTGNGGSASIRMADILAAFRTWMAHPVFGAGFYNLPEIYQFYTPVRSSGNPTCGVLNVFAFGGVYLFVFYLGGYVSYFLRGKNEKQFLLVKLIVLVLLMACISADQYEYLTLLLIGYGWSIYGDGDICRREVMSF